MTNVLVEFVDDIYPHCKGDVVKISTEEKAAFDKTIEVRGINGYKLIDTKPKDTETKTEKDVKAEEAKEVDAPAKTDDVVSTSDDGAKEAEVLQSMKTETKEVKTEAKK